VSGQGKLVGSISREIKSETTEQLALIYYKGGFKKKQQFKKIKFS
jgi:hypothetical protein